MVHQSVLYGCHVGLSGDKVADKKARTAILGRDEVTVLFTVNDIGCLVKKHVMPK